MTQGWHVLLTEPRAEYLALEEPKAHRSHTKVLIEFIGRSVPTQVTWESLRPMDGEIFGPNPRPRGTRGKGAWIRGFRPRASSVA